MDIQKLFREAFNPSSANEKIITKVNEEDTSEETLKAEWEAGWKNEWDKEYQKLGGMVIRVTSFFGDLSIAMNDNFHVGTSFEDEVSRMTGDFSDPRSFAHLIDSTYMAVEDLKEMLENPDTELSSDERRKLELLSERGEHLADDLSDFDAYLEENNYFQGNELNEEIEEVDEVELDKQLEKLYSMITKIVEFYGDLAQAKVVDVDYDVITLEGETKEINVDKCLSDTEYLQSFFECDWVGEDLGWYIEELKERLENTDTELSNNERTKIKHLIKRAEDLSDQLPAFEKFLEENEYFFDVLN